MARKNQHESYDGELVVLHDQISYHDPEHEPYPGQPRNLLYANRGQRVGGDEDESLPGMSNGEAKRLLALGAVTDNADTLAAKLALSGQQPDTRLSTPYMTLSSPAEQIRAHKSVAASGGSGPQSSKRDLARLALADLKAMAVAFGHGPIAESDDKDEIIAALKGEGEDAASAEEVANQRQRRDEAQISAREVSHESGTLGSDVISTGVAATTGEKTAALSDESGGASTEGAEGTVEARDGGSGGGSTRRRRPSRKQQAEQSE